MTLRTKLSLFLSALLSLSIGLTGGLLILESARTFLREVGANQQLLAENRAFALRDNLEILEGELVRLSLLPDIDPSDRNPEPESRLLEYTHSHSVLYNTAVLLLSDDGTCIGAVPDVPHYRSRSFRDLDWFQEAKRGADRPLFRVTDDPTAGRTLDIIQPIFRAKRFGGALVGKIALDQANLVVSAISANLPALTEAMLIDAQGRVVFPTYRRPVRGDSGWGKAIQAAERGEPGTVSAVEAGEQSLFAFAPVGASSGYSVVFRRPWSELTSHLRRQVMALLAVLALGMGVAAVCGLILSAYVTSPLRILRESADRIARGQHRPTVALHGSTRGDELGQLVQDFLQMERAIMQRDQELREAALLLERRVRERTRELEATQKALLDAERFAAMGKTSAAIAHELKNALNGLGMAVELILEDPTNLGRVQRLKTQVLLEIGRLRDVVDSLVSFSRPPRLEPRLEHLSEVVGRALQLAGDIVTDRGATLTTETDELVQVVCDARKIQGVVINLVKNAAEAGSHVHVRTATCDGYGFIEVEDDGPGFSDEAAGHLFEPFFTTKQNGTGLGLPTSLRYIEAHGGSLRVLRSERLGGALVRVQLPLAPETGADKE